MDKEQVSAKLTEMGYNAVLDGSVIMCTLESEKAARRLRKALKELSYNGSWGYRIRKDVKNEAEAVCSGENSSEVSDGGGSARDVVLPHEELSEYSGIREHREQAESNGNLPNDESERGSRVRQYCRYCSFCCYGDIPYCTFYEKELTDKKIRQQNRCVAFDLSPLGDVESGKQYRPRKNKENADCDGQIPWMKKDRRHRIASRKGEEYEWEWLATVVSGAAFALVGSSGAATYGSASGVLGVRPAFKIRNL